APLGGTLPGAERPVARRGGASAGCAHAAPRPRALTGGRGPRQSTTVDGRRRSGTRRPLRLMLDAALPSSAVDPVDGVDPPVPTGIVWDDALGEYDFGPFHPTAPIRLTLTRELARCAGLLDRPGLQTLP